MSKIINIIDVESTCESGRGSGYISEIIEIGISTVNTETLEMKTYPSIFIKPIFNGISDYCHNLTGITQSVVDDGISFKEACNILRKQFASKKRTWASYGNYDRAMFERMDDLYEPSSDIVLYPFGPNHINIKELFRIVYNLNKPVDMIKALNIMNLYHIGRHHNGSDDCYNISCIFIELLKRLQKGD